MKEISCSFALRESSKHEVVCDKHFWVDSGDGRQRCSRCDMFSVFRASQPVNVVYDSDLSGWLYSAAMWHAECYNRVCDYLAEVFSDAMRKASEIADEHADSEGFDRYLPTEKQIKKFLPSYEDLTGKITVWRHSGQISRDRGSSTIQRDAASKALCTFLARYRTKRKSFADHSRVVKKNENVRTHNASAKNTGEKKKQIKHPRRSTHRNMAIDMTCAEPLKKNMEEITSEGLSFGTKASIDSFDRETGIIKIVGMPEMRINREIPADLDLSAPVFLERTKKITCRTEPESRTWSVRFPVRCAVPAPVDISEIKPSDIVSVDVGKTHTMATSDRELWSAPPKEDSFRKTRSLHRGASKHKNGSRKHKAISRKTGKETKKRSSRDKSTKTQKAAEIAATKKEIVLESLNLPGMTASAKGTSAQPGKKVAQKRGLNRVMQSAACGFTQISLQEAFAVRAGQITFLPAPNTSRTCPFCFRTFKDSRKGESFKCLHCSHADQADLNAAAWMKTLRLVQGGRASFTQAGMSGEKMSSSAEPAKGEAGRESESLCLKTPQGKKSDTRTGKHRKGGVAIRIPACADQISRRTSATRHVGNLTKKKQPA